MSAEIIYGIDFVNKSKDLARMYSEGMEIVSAALQDDTAPCEMIPYEFPTFIGYTPIGYVAPDKDPA